MPDRPPQRSPFGDVAPALATITDDVLFGDVWEQPGLSPRAVTIARAVFAEMEP